MMDMFGEEDAQPIISPPTAYQGGKQRISKEIIDLINPSKDSKFYDLCCGSGSITIELINRGYDPRHCSMCDAGPWGIVWDKVGRGSFDLDRFAKVCSEVPKDLSKVQFHAKELSSQAADIDTPYVFLILQASSFGSKAIWIEDNKWRNCSFRSYWLPTESSSRRSPVNPMMPQVETLYARMVAICKAMKGVCATRGDIDQIEELYGNVYIDPPYRGTTMYGHMCDAVALAKRVKVPVYISEGVSLSDNSLIISSGRSKGGISGERKKNANEEWLSAFNAPPLKTVDG